MKSRPAALALLLALGALAAPAHAQDDAMARDAKARVEYFDKFAGKVKDDTKFSELVMDLASFPHEITVERVGRILLRDNDEEHKLIASAAMAEFKDPKVLDAAGKVLVKAIQAEFSNDVLDNTIDAVGKIGYRDAVPLLNEIALGGGDPFVLLTTVRAMGRLKDRRALPALLELWERNPVGYKWTTGEVKVDTGTAGDGDQKAAEAKWRAKYGNKMKGRGKPPVMFKVYIQELIRTVRILTGDETIEMPEDLRKWMEARREQLAKEGVEIPKFKGPAKADDDKDGKGGKDAKGDAPAEPKK
jgi:hypothetical protein